MTKEQLQHLKDLCAAATPGPSVEDEIARIRTYTGRFSDTQHHVELLEDLARALEEMFAAARTALPELIAEVERLRAENRVLKQEINAEALYHDLPERYPLEGDR